jgi:hypothetical protein
VAVYDCTQNLTKIIKFHREEQVDLIQRRRLGKRKRKRGASQIFFSTRIIKMRLLVGASLTVLACHHSQAFQITRPSFHSVSPKISARKILIQQHVDSCWNNQNDKNVFAVDKKSSRSPRSGGLVTMSSTVSRDTDASLSRAGTKAEDQAPTIPIVKTPAAVEQSAYAKQRGDGMTGGGGLPMPHKKSKRNTDDISDLEDDDGLVRPKVRSRNLQVNTIMGCPSLGGLPWCVNTLHYAHNTKQHKTYYIQVLDFYWRRISYFSTLVLLLLTILS